MMTIQKISFVALLIAMFFVAAFSVASFASAQVSGDSGTGCSGCGGGSTGGDVNGGSTDGGGGTTTVIPAPVCDITANKQYVNPGEQYTISWSNGSVGTYKVGGVAVERTGFLTYTWNADNIFLTFTVTGVNSSGATCSDTVTVYRMVEAPTCDINTNLTAVNDGQTFTISWNGTPSHSTVFKVNNQIVAAVDSQTYTWPAGRTTPVTVTMTGTNAKGTCTDTVTVYPKTNPPAVPVCDFINASPVTITRGQSSTLSWGTTNVTSASINNGVGSVAVDGSTTVSPNDTTTYTLTGVGANNQQVTCAKTVTVTPVVVNAPVCDYFTASPVTITRGQSTTLTWGTTNASSAFINNGVGNVDVDGSRTVSPLETTTYTLTATGAENKTVSCTKTIVVDQPEVKTPRCEYFNASATSINRGNSVTLSWDTTNANSVVINPGVGTVAVDGSTTVSPSDTTTYTLTITGENNQTASCTRTVTVETGGGGGGGSSSPKCTLKISDNKITRGQRVTLKWDTSRATEVTIKDNHGKTLVSTDDVKSSEKKDLYDGEIELRPEKDTTYTLLAERGSKDRTCKVSVDVSGGVTVTEIRDQKPVVTGIALTQVPYTGFEAGPFLTMIFYGLLLLWALYLAYVLVVRRQSIAAVAVATPAPVAPTFTPAAIAPATNTPRFVASAVAEPVAVATPVIGYATPVAHDAAYEATALAIEEAAHREHILFSSEAMRLVIDTTTEATRATTVAAVIGKAKASYPTEDGWVVITIDRMKSLLAAIA